MLGYPQAVRSVTVLCKQLEPPVPGEGDSRLCQSLTVPGGVQTCVLRELGSRGACLFPVSGVIHPVLRDGTETNTAHMKIQVASHGHRAERADEDVNLSKRRALAEGD